MFSVPDFSASEWRPSEDCVGRHQSYDIRVHCVTRRRTQLQSTLRRVEPCRSVRHSALRHSACVSVCFQGLSPPPCAPTRSTGSCWSRFLLKLLRRSLRARCRSCVRGVRYRLRFTMSVRARVYLSGCVCRDPLVCGSAFRAVHTFNAFVESKEKWTNLGILRAGVQAIVRVCVPVCLNVCVVRFHGISSPSVYGRCISSRSVCCRHRIPLDHRELHCEGIGGEHGAACVCMWLRRRLASSHMCNVVPCVDYGVYS